MISFDRKQVFRSRFSCENSEREERSHHLKLRVGVVDDDSIRPRGVEGTEVSHRRHCFQPERRRDIRKRREPETHSMADASRRCRFLVSLGAYQVECIFERLSNFFLRSAGERTFRFQRGAIKSLYFYL